MAKTETFTQACSQVGSFSFANYFTLYVELTDRDGSASTNVSQVDYNVYCKSSGAGSISANHTLYFQLNSQTIRNENVYVDVSSPNANIPIASGTLSVAHNNDGSKSISFGASIAATGGYGVSASKDGVFILETIPRYASISTSNGGSTINGLTVIWSTTESVDFIQYSLNGGTWQNAVGTGDDRSGQYNITGLIPNTSYTVKTRCKRTGTDLWSESNTLTINTKDIAKISSLTNFEHGSNVVVGITNPASIASLNLVMKIGTTQIFSRTVVAGNNTIAFTDTELDNIYKLYGSSSSLTASFVLTGSGYTNSKTCTITFKGNQKTIRINVNSSWKRGKLWTNVNGTWKRAVIWTNVNGTWKRGI